MTYASSGKLEAITSAMTSSVSRQAVPLPIAMMLRLCFCTNSTSFDLASARLSTVGAAGSGGGASGVTGVSVVDTAGGSTTGPISGVAVVVSPNSGVGTGTSIDTGGEEAASGFGAIPSLALGVGA